ncbi:MAG: hypothetical protein HY300_00720 [Verrucomicrobia bacterium]|nr:hypothetical protein [Verrucomicrobiota bacterium]
MTPNRILPDLQCSLVCEDIRREANGNFIILGVLSFMRFPQMPVAGVRFYLFNRWTSGFGQFTETVRIIAPDQSTVLQKSEMKFALQDPAHNATNVTLVPPIEFRAEGIYFVEVLVDDVMKLRLPLPVVVVQPAQPQGQPPAAPEAKA